MDIVEDFDEKSYNNNGKPWKSSRILRVNPIVSFFFLFSSFFSIFCSFLHLLIFSVFHFLFSFFSDEKSFFFSFFLYFFQIFFFAGVSIRV